MRFKMFQKKIALFSLITILGFISFAVNAQEPTNTTTPPATTPSTTGDTTPTTAGTTTTSTTTTETGTATGSDTSSIADVPGGGGGSTTALLAAIARFTNGILVAVTETSNPVVLAIVTALNNITSPDNATDPATPTPAMQSNFASYAAKSAESKTAQDTLQQRFTQDLFSTNITLDTISYANDLAFQAVLGKPFFNPDPRKDVDPAYNYLKYASGINLEHPVPQTNWQGNRVDQLRYINYFNSSTAIQTFNSYILSQIYTDLKSGIPEAQKNLINQASDATTWFATITTESIGAVLRQTLMYQSQSYILLNQILETEKMLLAAQAMNNTLTMLSGQAGESLMINKAIRKTGGDF